MSSVLAGIDMSSFKGDDLVGLIAVTGGLVIALVSIVGSFIKNVTITRHKEESRREIAAYIAEGSMSPEDGKAILEAKIRGGGCKV